MGSVAALIALIMLFILIFCILGMNLMGGQLIIVGAEEGDLMRGMDVYVQVPGDDLGIVPFPFQVPNP